MSSPLYILGTSQCHCDQCHCGVRGTAVPDSAILRMAKLHVKCRRWPSQAYRLRLKLGKKNLDGSKRITPVIHRHSPILYQHSTMSQVNLQENVAEHKAAATSSLLQASLSAQCLPADFVSMKEPSTKFTSVHVLPAIVHALNGI